MDRLSRYMINVRKPNNDQSNAVWNNIRSMYVNQRLSDITLVVGGISYPAHRFVLCVSSDVFEIMLNSMWSESQQQVVELQEDPQCFEAFPMFLQYFYSGTVSLDQTNVMPILVLADKYNVMNLTVLCVQYMLTHIVEAAQQGHLILWFQYVLSVNQPSSAEDSYYYEMWKDTGSADIKPPWYNLLEACSSFIKWNLDLCVKSFNTFECDVLIGLLKQSDLVVHDEMQLFGYVASWLNHQSTGLVECNDADANEADMSSLTELVMSHIRYPMLLPRQMAELLMVPIVKQNREFFFEKMAAAMEYYTVEIEPLSSMANSLERTPRLYTSQRWGDSFSVSLQNRLPFTRKLETCSSLFDKEEEQNKSHWEIEFTAERLLRPLMQTPQVVHLQIKKLRAENTSRHIRVTILVYGPQKDVVSVVQNFAEFSIESKIDVPILEDIVRFYNRIPLKLRIIITPIAVGCTDCHVDPIIQHRL